MLLLRLQRAPREHQSQQDGEEAASLGLGPCPQPLGPGHSGQEPAFSCWPQR